MARQKVQFAIPEFCIGIPIETKIDFDSTLQKAHVKVTPKISLKDT